MPRLGTGQPNSRVMLVGECFTIEEEKLGEAFLGQAGETLNKLLHEAGILRSECYATNVCNCYAPNASLDSWMALKKKDISANHVLLRGRYVLPQIVRGDARLQREIEMIQPNIIITFGNAALWLLTGAEGVGKWRGSQLLYERGSRPFKLIPTHHPSTLVYAHDNRPIMTMDLRRAAKELSSKAYANVPKWNFILRPSFPTVVETLSPLISRMDKGERLWIDFDLETRAGHIACAGFSWTKEDAICVPLMCVEDRNGYWSVEEEGALVHLFYRLLTHPNVLVRGQNLLYDAQYTHRHWHFIPRVAQDTMISHHTMWAGLPKKLDFQASMYCNHYLYWKDDGKTWTADVGEDQLWGYNCVDCVRTREIGEVELSSISSMGLSSVEDFQQSLFWPVLQAMIRGVKIDRTERRNLDSFIEGEISRREAFLSEVCGHPLNPGSSKQMIAFFYNDLALKPVMSKAKKGVPSHVTCDDDALVVLAKREPIIAPFIEIIQQLRSLRVYLSTFVRMKLDDDGRMRCSYNICGTETYRFNSSKNAFDSGGNLQNLPKGNEE